MIADVAILKVSSTRRALQELQNILDTNSQSVAVGIDCISASINKALCCAKSFLPPLDDQSKPSVALDSNFVTRIKFFSPRFIQTSKIQKTSRKKPKRKEHNYNCEWYK